MENYLPFFVNLIFSSFATISHYTAWLECDSRAPATRDCLCHDNWVCLNRSHSFIRQRFLMYKSCSWEVAPEISIGEDKEKLFKRESKFEIHPLETLSNLQIHKSMSMLNHSPTSCNPFSNRCHRKRMYDHLSTVFHRSVGNCYQQLFQHYHFICQHQTFVLHNSYHSQLNFCWLLLQLVIVLSWSRFFSLLK